MSVFNFKRLDLEQGDVCTIRPQGQTNPALADAKAEFMYQNLTNGRVTVKLILDHGDFRRGDCLFLQPDEVS